jgi:hypothetical protein
VGAGAWEESDRRFARPSVKLKKWRRMRTEVENDEVGSMSIVLGATGMMIE